LGEECVNDACEKRCRGRLAT